MFTNILQSNKSSKSLVGNELDTDISRRNYTTYVPKEVLENEIYNHNRPYVDVPHDCDLTFAQNFINKEGRFVYCISKEELKEKINSFFEINQIKTAFIWEDEIISLLKSENINLKFGVERTIDQAKVAISHCESLIADEGNIIINSNQNRFRPLDNFPEYHLIIASKRQVKINIEHAVSDFMIQHPEVFPFIIDISKEEKSIRFALNKSVLLSRGTKNVIVFYCEDCTI